MAARRSNRRRPRPASPPRPEPLPAVVEPPDYGRTNRLLRRMLLTCPEPPPLLAEWPPWLPDWAPALTKVSRWMEFD